MILSKAVAINNSPQQLIITTVFCIQGHPKSVREFFQSYGRTIALRLSWEYKKGNEHPEKQQVFLDENVWNFSNVTSRYRNIFLDEQKKVTENKIRLGDYELTDLNEMTIKPDNLSACSLGWI